jgi:protein O-GlcNAc transferase
MTAEAALELLHNGDPRGALGLLAESELLGEVAPAWHAAHGVVLLANDLPDQALRALHTAVALGDSSPHTLLNLALAEHQVGNPGRGIELMQMLEQQLPSWEEPTLRLAECRRAAGDGRGAEQAYQRVLQINPRREEALLALAGLLIARGDGDAAGKLLMRCCGLAPHRAEAWDALGLSLMMTGDAPAAASAFSEAQKTSPRTLEYALHRVDAALAGDDAASLLASLQAAIKNDPLDPVASAAHGVLLHRLGHVAEAIDALETATLLAPEAKLPALLLGRSLAHANRMQEAEIALRRAIALNPDDPLLPNDLAVVLMRLQRQADAHAELVALVEAHGENVTVLCNLANITVCLGLQDEAVALARRAIDLAPNAVLPRRVLSNTLPYQSGVTGEELLAVLRNCSDRLPRHELPACANSPDPDRPLVVGLLSGTLKTHPVGWLTIAGFEALNPADYAIICLVQNGGHDLMGRRFRAVAREWHDIDMVGDVALAEQARAIGIDVLIDLGGYGDGGRMPACANRLAPVQIKWVGMQNHSSGLAEMDWIMTDRWETPPELEHLYSERALRLADGYVCYSPPPYALDVAALPALANGHITFGCFNNLAKVTPQVIATWCEVLRRIPRSRLVLKTTQFADAPTAERILASFVAHGIGPARLDLRGPSGHRAFMGEYNQIDIVLDPFPYSGGLTTCEALWMGVPTVTLPGESFASRHSMSHLSNAGLHDWVAPDLAGYVELAMAKASDIPALAAFRSRLRAQVKSSPLCDATRFGHSLAAALRHAWQDWCTQQ